MKKILEFIIVLGFVLMLGAAGSADFASMSFVKVLFLEILGMLVVLLGTSGLLHYKRYVRRMMRKRSVNRMSAKSKTAARVSIRIPEKELC